ncbi:hypothetical protein EBN03_10795 [Nocardia stercoris]|uniref:Uncharacterized protein n=1 Tax=Nocardia stercoris TaxID=2483361 RepID=A0A3M2L7B0_9NOCA|nr:hypothetical protein EBN03_10795 [Nocardia stercoris]
MFCDYPTIKEMAMAVEEARSGVVAVLEGPPSIIRVPLAGWAAAVGAVDALTGTPAEPVPDEIRSRFEQLALYGNNGYHRGAGENVQVMVPTIAREIREAGFDDDFIVSYLLAYGLSADDVAGLRKMIG